VAINNEELRKILYEKIHQIEGVGSTDSFFSFGSAFEKNLTV
jgi:Lrp/AsnC family transcriptional regulator for asnA, asnC and gidA